MTVLLLLALSGVAFVWLFRRRRRRVTTAPAVNVLMVGPPTRDRRHGRFHGDGGLL